MAPPSGPNLMNPLLLSQHNQSVPRGVSEKCQSFSCVLLCWQTPSLTQRVPGSAPPPCRCSVCSHLVRYVQAQTVNNGGEQTTTTELKHAHVKEKNMKTDQEKQFKNKELDRAGEKTRINIRTSFPRWRSCWICEDFRTLLYKC